MNTKSRFWLWVVVIGLAFLLIQCVPPDGVATDESQPVIPGDGGEVSQSGTGETEPGQEVLTFCDDPDHLIPLKAADEERITVEQDITTITRTYSSDGGGTFIQVDIAVSGYDEKAILGYFDDARFCFEFLPLPETGVEVSKDETLGEPLEEDSDRTPEDLFIDLALLNEPPMEGDYEKGYSVKWAIDPRINAFVTHKYFKSTSSFSVTVKADMGSVLARLYKRFSSCGFVVPTAQVKVVKTAGPNGTPPATPGSAKLSHSSSSPAVYQLSIKNPNGFASRYSLSGSIYKSYTDPTPVPISFPAGTPTPCP